MSEKWSWWPDCCRDGGMITDDGTAVHIAAPTYYESAPEMTAKHARLLASAPELLEALQLCANVLAGHELSKSALTRALEKSAAAIAKATAKGK